MINQQCYTVKEVIKQLQQYNKPDDVIIFDYLNTEDIAEAMNEFLCEVSKDTIHAVMRALDNKFDFAIGNAYDCEGDIGYMINTIQDDIQADIKA